MTDENLPLPQPPLVRYYIEGGLRDVPGEVAWVDAESAVDAACMADVLYRGWSRFSKIEWVSAQTGEVLSFTPNLDDTLAELAAIVAAQANADAV